MKIALESIQQDLCYYGDYGDYGTLSEKTLIEKPDRIKILEFKIDELTKLVTRLTTVIENKLINIDPLKGL